MGIRTVSELYPRQWLVAGDLPKSGARVQVAGVEVRTFRRRNGKEEPAAVLSFTANGRACERRLILNVTQCRALTTITGSEVFDDWIGTEVILRPATAPNGKPTIAVAAIQTPAEGDEGGA